MIQDLSLAVLPLIYLSRRCPGSDLVDCTVWLLLATMIATVDISIPLDKNGSTIEPQLEFDNLFFR